MGQRYQARVTHAGRKSAECDRRTAGTNAPRIHCHRPAAVTTRGRILDRVPAPISLRLRAERNVRRLFGLHAPADLVTSLVPRDRNAVDVGANRGIYTYWIAKRARRVDAFEPQPALANYMRAARLGNVSVHETALSDREGTVRLLIPEDDGLAHIAAADGDLSTTDGSGLGVRTALRVRIMPLDSFHLTDVGFIKIDAEGHELPVLRGARHTISTGGPVIFIESEARHARGAPDDVIRLLHDELGYRKAAFVRHWKLVDINEFDVERDQVAFLPDYTNPRYVSNFVFWP